MSWVAPKFLRLWLLRLFAAAYRIQIEEAEYPLEHYQSIADFFVRRLKSDRRPIGSAVLLHPADSLITVAGPIAEGQLVQAKSKKYSVTQFLGRDTNRFNNGAFLTYYLCPTDYHRVHSPIDGWIRSVIHIPGTLWPVNSWSTNNIDSVFCINERVIIEIESAYGPLAVVMVGAMDVGKMSLSFWPDFTTNLAEVREPRERLFGREALVSKGDELGAFHFGSTVVVLMAPEFLSNMGLAAQALKILTGERVQVRSNLLPEKVSATASATERKNQI